MTLEKIFKNPNLKMEAFNKKKNGTFLIVFLIIALILVSVNEILNRFEYATNNLTVKDFAVCIEEINSTNFIECQKYLIENNKKDFSAIWKEISGGA